MKREEKNALSRQRIFDAAMQEFAAKGYEGASLNTVCAEHNFSKGIIYHYFKDKDELYLLCVADCFETLTGYLKGALEPTGSVERRLNAYFDARLRFFAEHPLYLGIFADAALTPPPALLGEILSVRRDFDALNISVLTQLLESAKLRPGISIAAVVEDFRMYLDYFNLRFHTVMNTSHSPAQALHEHEQLCHRQLDILLHGVLEGGHE